MKKNGFVTSALLYGVLSLFLVLILGTVAVIGNRKITNDKIKQSALDDVQNLSTDEECFNVQLNSRDNYTIIGYNSNNNNCYNTVYIPEKISGLKVDEIGGEAFKNSNIINITIKSNISYINDNSFDGVSNVLFIIKGTMPKTINNGSYQQEDNTRIWGATESSIRQD